MDEMGVDRVQGYEAFCDDPLRIIFIALEPWVRATED
jgi:hypothetical protein